MEKSLGDIALDKYCEVTTQPFSVSHTFSLVAEAVEKEVLARTNKAYDEPVASQELTHNQVIDWIKKYGSTRGLQFLYEATEEWLDAKCDSTVNVNTKYRVTDKENQINDPMTWKHGVKIFVRDSVTYGWLPATFRKLVYREIGRNDGNRFYINENSHAYTGAMLATQDKLELWQSIKDLG